MSSDPSQTDRDEAASRWFARLNQPTVRTEDLMGFRVWRREPDNARAFEAVEALWGRSEALSSDPKIQEALDGARSRATARRKRKGRLSLLAAGAAAGAAAAALIGACVLVGPSLLGWRAYDTAVGEQRTVRLADGSHVRLDTDSRVLVRLTRRARTITLARGQAFFDVIHRADQPFTVHAGGAIIHDLGTRFDVRRQGSQAAITLVEGALDVSAVGSSAPSLRLTPGQQAVVAGALPILHRRVDLAKATAWTTGWLVFDNLPLSAAAAEIDRYAPRPVVVDAADVARIPVSGSFRAEDADAFAAAVAKLYGLETQRGPDGALHLSRSTQDKPG